MERPHFDIAASGARMRQIRRQRNLSVKQVQEYMEFESAQSIYKWEEGRSLPQADNLVALAFLYQVNPAELLVEEDRASSSVRLWRVIVMYFLIDFENVKNNGMRGTEYLEAGDDVTIFYSEAAKSCERRYLDMIEDSGCGFDVCRLVNTGKNGLDFYIASRLGEFYGKGYRGQAAIVSNDKGFRAVRDYWRLRLPEHKPVVIAPTIEKGLIAGNDDSERIKNLQRETASVDIKVFQAKYEERQKLRHILQETFRETPYIDKMPEIQKLMETGKTPKVIYLNSLRCFGKKQGLEIYDHLKPVLRKQA